MKKTMMKAVLAAAMLVGSILGQVGSVHATTAKPTAAPIMRDNLSKYGLVKDVELPVTLTAGGLSYTLEKIMIYDIKSKDAQALIKKYGYTGTGNYFVWTKIIIENKGGIPIEQSANSPDPKWRLSLTDGGILAETMPRINVKKKNNKEAIWDWSLKPGEKLTTYQGLMYSGTKFDHFVIWLNIKGSKAEKYIVNRGE
ncbi:hypothetical protein [Paenibacillus sp. sgz5001063]|uniref:hypothetical protein n=1 Tax=Paenibacillus sp. sgz5001063 TaxID=3242474 RepID=UPI0036D2287A